MSKSDRVLILFYRLLMGEHIQKPSFMEEFSVGRRSFDRYIASVRLMLSETFAPHELCYDADANEYYLTGLKNVQIHGLHVLPLIILLLESRVLSNGDTAEIMGHLLVSLPQKEQQMMKSVIRETGNGYESDVANSMLKLLWDLNFVILRRQRIRLWYGGEGESLQSRMMMPSKLSYVDSQFVLEAWDEEGEPSSLKVYPLCRIRFFEMATV